ncbi:hypothetical protein EDB83DRAFT_2555614 [Lactarius deliciosus]|nr:hypothetical protein EDB83DRAFT_2555614 [Lactarius deliciosus]
MRYYHLISVLSVVILLGSLAQPFSPRWDDMRIKHSWNAVQENWESLGNPLSGTTIDLYIALKAHRENALIDTLYQEQATVLVSPPPRTLELVNSWLEFHGVPSLSVSMTHGGTTLTLRGVSVIQANALLGASYQLYGQVETNETVVRTVGYALPDALHGLVQTVAPPTTCFSTPHMQSGYCHIIRRRVGAATCIKIYILEIIMRLCAPILLVPPFVCALVSPFARHVDTKEGIRHLSDPRSRAGEEGHDFELAISEISLLPELARTLSKPTQAL